MGRARKNCSFFLFFHKALDLYEQLDPLTIRLLNPTAIMAGAQRLTKLLQKLWFSRGVGLLVWFLSFKRGT
jgi:hypothetical protein